MCYKNIASHLFAKCVYSVFERTVNLLAEQRLCKQSILDTVAAESFVGAVC